MAQIMGNRSWRIGTQGDDIIGDMLGSDLVDAADTPLRQELTRQP